ncbi:hypothetical protein KEG38_29605 [Polyangium jinanense]|uniref:hypothetical protein n=1 Tax=Polyangium jinanense TaxID=2829994 RepID=UPI0023422D29|nr:hypothetical protein [Polyangium jinanense]MDC3958050.1 hypothetical protein [Polyangium jinanense]
MTLNAMAFTAARQGDAEHALDLLNQAIAIHEQIGNDWGKIDALIYMSFRVSEHGDEERSRDLWNQATTLMDTTQQHPG